jgi:RNA polymerase sigma factor (TIGR02999 family)
MNEADFSPNSLEAGHPQAAEELLILVYNDLRRLAASRMAQQPSGQTLQATALVHEVWLKVAGAQPYSFKNRAHFFAVAAEAMRRILIDRARHKRAVRHGGALRKVEFDDLEIAAPGGDDQLIAMHEALTKFAEKHPAQAEVVKLRYFVGLTNEEVARVQGISLSTVKNYWNFSRAWLFSAIKGE